MKTPSPEIHVVYSELVAGRFTKDLFCCLVIKSQGHRRDAFSDALTTDIVKFYFLLRFC